MKAEPALGYRDDEAGSGGDCGNLCKASLLTLAGFGTLAVVNGLGRELAEIKKTYSLISCRTKFLKSLSILLTEKEAVADKVSRRVDHVKRNV